MNIKVYLKTALELEKILYTLNKAIRNLQHTQKDLGIRRSYKAPKEPTGTTISFLLEEHAGTNFCIAFLVALGCGIYSVFHKGNFWAAFIVGGLLILTVLYLIEYTFEVNMDEHSYTRYVEEFQRYVALEEKDDLRVQQELKKKRNIDLQISALQKKYESTSKTLQKLYAMNVVYPKYRHLIAIATLYEYFEAGRCNNLEGYDGAYNMFENELRLNAILVKLNDIINHLEEIRTSQYAVYNAISEGNRVANAIYRHSQKISGTMTTIADNVAITAYNSSILAQNIETEKFIANNVHL